jgi:dihydroneopterin aldolase
MQQSILAELLQNRPTGVTTLFVEDLVRDIEIGVFEHERGVQQRVRFDIEVHIEGTSEPPTDELIEVLDYDFIKAELCHLLDGPRIELLETLCARLLDSILCQGQVIGACVSASKLDVLPENASLGCRMCRLR